MQRSQRSGERWRSASDARSKRGAAQLVEFAAALGLLLLAVILPIAAAGRLLTTLAVGQYIAAYAVDPVSKAVSYDGALASCVDEVKAFTQSGFGSLAQIRPVAGYRCSGADLFVDIRDKLSDHVVTIGPNVPYVGVIDREKKTYSYRLVVHFATGLSLPPVLRCPGIDYVNKPLVLNFTASKLVEHPDGICVCLCTLSTQGGRP